MTNKRYSISLSKIKAIIFDMDDLMVDSTLVHGIVFEKVLDRYGISVDDPKNLLTKEDKLSFYGMKIVDIFAFLIKKYKLEPKASAQKMNEEFNKLLLQTYEKNIQAMPGLTDLVGVCKSKGYKLAVVSSAKKVKIDIVLRKFNLTDTFDAIVSGEDENIRGKPAPDMFLAGAKKLGVNPRNCLVLEDAKNGVKSAKAAGMIVIGVHNKFTYQRLGLRQDLYAADLEVNGLDEVTMLFSQNA